MDVDELRPGLWRWTARHPEWTAEDGMDDGQGWGAMVSCYAWNAPDALVLFDPLAPAEGTADAERFWSALDRDVARIASPTILLTCRWHARSTRAILERYDGAEHLAHAASAEQVAERAPVTRTFAIGDALPGGVLAIDTCAPDGELFYWLPALRVLVAGDVLLGAQGKSIHVCPEAWLGRDGDREHVKRDLADALGGLDVELLLPAHGAPISDDARALLDRALEPVS